MEQYNRKIYRVKKKKKKKRKRILTFLVLLCLISLSYTGYFLFETYKAASKSFVELENRSYKSKLREQPVKISNDPVSILLMGIEDYSGEYDQGRSDTLMVATFNPDDQTMKLLSIPRDTRVKIPGLKYKNKINHAYSIGKKELTIETVENLLDIPIDYYIAVNFQGFINIVDELGGVKVDVPFDFYDINSDWETFYFKKGEMKLDGEAALVYARMRKKDPRGDFGRNERQRQIVTSIIDKLTSPKMVFKIDDIAEEIGENVETNISVQEALAFRQKYDKFNASKIENLTFEGEDQYIDGVYYFVPDDESLEAIKEELQNHLEHKPISSTDSP
jgi:polyisoprenyl-teichoic acid--peptidoglycan teichoic acid transferase